MNKIVLLYGGMGQELLKRSKNPPSALWSAQVLSDEPEIVEAVHLDYIKAGARVITLNSYSITPERLNRDSEHLRFDTLQAAAISIAQSARDKSGEDVSIAGCLPPLVASYQTDLTPDTEHCLESYRAIVAAQKNDVDVFICETMSSVHEVRCTTRAAVESGLPVWSSMSVDDSNGAKLRSGEPLDEGMEAAVEAGANAVLVNCSWPEALLQSMPVLARSGLPYGGYANGFTSITSLQPGGTVDTLKAGDDLDPVAYAKHVQSCFNNGASILGGCCETGPAHIAEIARQLRDNNFSIARTLTE